MARRQEHPQLEEVVASHAMDALRESTARLELAATLADLGTWSVELRTGAATQDSRLRAMLGVPDDDRRPATEVWMERIHPSELRATRRRVLELLRNPGTTRTFRAEHRIIQPDGTTRWLSIAGQLLADQSGIPERMVGVAQDITRWRQLHHELQRWADVFQHTTHAVILADARTNLILDVNPALAQVLGYSRRELRGMSLTRIYDQAHLHQFEEAVRVANSLGRVVIETVYARRDGSTVPVEVDATLVTDEAGAPLYRIANVRDLSEEHRRRGRQQVLIQAGELLASSLDYEATIQRIVELAVPTFADWSFFMAGDEDGGMAGLLRTLSFHHPDPALREGMRAISARSRVRVDNPAGAGRALRTGEPELVSELTEERLAALTRDPEQLRLIRELGFRSFINVPLAARGQTFGVLCFVTSDSGRRYGTDDLRFAQELAHRAAMAIDNARQYAAERTARERTERLQGLATALSGARTPAQVGHAILHESITATSADCGAVWLDVDEGDGVLQLLAEHGLPDELVGAIRPVDPRPESALAELVAGGRTHVLLTPDEWEDVQASTQESSSPTAGRLAGVGTIACLPLLRDDSVRGLVALGFGHGPGLTEEGLDFMRAATRQGAQAMDRALLLETAERARHEAEAANAAKSDFLAVMSHELRTPLNAIAGYTQLLELGVRGPVTAEQLEDLGRIQRSQRHLLTLINDVLNFARLEAGRIEYEMEALPVSELLSHATEILAPQAESRGVGFRTVDHEGLTVDADREKVQQILLNLLANAIRFTPAGGLISVAASPEDDTVLLEVRDTGPGIPTDQHERVFEPFVQLGRSRTQPGEGTGLGLAISRDLARGMGGELTVEDADGGGARFILTLRRA